QSQSQETGLLSGASINPWVTVKARDLAASTSPAPYTGHPPAAQEPLGDKLHESHSDNQVPRSPIPIDRNIIFKITSN
ncbi:Hypothetical predicted protein, partial [Marmota monax]